MANKRTVRFILEVTIADLPRAERAECAKLGDCRTRDLPRMKDVEDFDLAHLIAESLPGNVELFGGSEMYCRIVEAKPKFL